MLKASFISFVYLDNKIGQTLNVLQWEGRANDTYLAGAFVNRYVESIVGLAMQKGWPLKFCEL